MIWNGLTTRLPSLAMNQIGTVVPEEKLREVLTATASLMNRDIEAFRMRKR